MKREEKKKKRVVLKKRMRIVEWCVDILVFCDQNLELRLTSICRAIHRS